MKRITGNIIVKLSLIAFSFFCVFSIITLQFKNNELKAQTQEVLEECNNAEAKNNELKRRIAEPIDDEYVKKYAKEHFNLRLPDEVVFYN